MTRDQIIVTGAAGILGTAICQTLARSGLSVIGIDISPPPPAGSTAWTYIGNIDLTDETQVMSEMKRLAGLRPDFIGIINVVGGFIWETVEAGSHASWDRMWAMNLKTCLNGARGALQHLRMDGGTIVNISAAASQKAAAGMGAYAASKSAVSRLTESLAEELKPRRIRVNALLPTIIDTPANRNAMPGDDPSLWVRPQELADITAFLISDAASAINGALIPVSGRL